MKTTDRKYLFAKAELLLKDFDFEKVRKVMEFVEWEWNISEEKRVPHANELESTARELLTWCINDIIDHKAQTSYCSTGGFIAECSWNEEEPIMSISFVLEDQSSLL